jgi:dolichyl-phosphate-mannose--protein O-mannosyl transferase
MRLPADKEQSLVWSHVDSAAVSAATVLAAALRFWHLGRPAEPVYDETKVLSQAQSFLHGWRPPYSTHPPAAKLLLALSVSLFGNYPWGWRAANALVGTALIPITYLLARRLFRSRLTACIAVGLLLCDGMVLVTSRLAMINALYITVAAWAYLILWCFAQEQDPRRQRLWLLALGVLLGLYAGAKTGISEVGILFVLIVVCAILVRQGSTQIGTETTGPVVKRVVAGCGLLIAVGSLVYLAVFLPLYGVGWRGVAGLIAYHRHVLRHNLSMPSDYPDASPFWSWPLLIHPYSYWKRERLDGLIQVIWCGGNPLLWWAILPAILIASIRGWRERDLAWMFLAGGYAAYFAMWIPLRRYLFIYSYMPAAYLGGLALAGALARCWRGDALRWERCALLAPLLPCLILPLGAAWGGLAASVILAAYFLLSRRSRAGAGRFVFLMLGGGVALLFAYFFPLWTGIPLSQAGYASRMWLHGQGMASWQ